MKENDDFHSNCCRVPECVHPRLLHLIHAIKNLLLMRSTNNIQQASLIEVMLTTCRSQRGYERGGAVPWGTVPPRSIAFHGEEKSDFLSHPPLNMMQNGAKQAAYKLLYYNNTTVCASDRSMGSSPVWPGRRRPRRRCRRSGWPAPGPALS
jgi:hypothetical protein